MSVIWHFCHYIQAGDRRAKGSLICPLSACVMTRQSCLGHGKLPSNNDNGRWKREPRRGASNILSTLPLVCLYWRCGDHFQEMTQELDWIHRKRLPLPFILCLFVFSNLFETGPTDMFLGLAAVWVGLFFMLRFYCCVELSKRSLIRLAVSHSLEISYAVWARLCCSVIFGRLADDSRLFPPSLCVCIKPAKHVLSLLAASADNKVVALNWSSR